MSSFSRTFLSTERDFEFANFSVTHLFTATIERKEGQRGKVG